MNIGIDVNSGERPFQELVEGVLYSSKRYKKSVFYMIGNTSLINESFPNICSYPNVQVIDAEDVIGMSESPLIAVRRKKKSSVVVGTKLLKNKTIDVFFSPGNTGATVMSAVVGLGLFHGFKRPVMGTFLPRQRDGETFILDVGANPELKEDTLYQNALMGKLFYETLFDKSLVRVGLLNVGTETLKGNLVLKKVYQDLSEIDSFVGNVEPYNIIDGSVDVVVCDGFTGNMVIKVSESFNHLITSKLKYYLGKVLSHSIVNKIFLGKLLKNIFNKPSGGGKSHFLRQMLPKYYGAAILLGVNGLVLVGHGSCTKDELINVVDYANFLVEKELFPKIFRSWKKNNKFLLNFFSKDI